MRPRLLRTGSLLIECASERHSKNLKSKLLYNIPIIVTPHTTITSSKGVVRSKDLEGVSLKRFAKTSPHKVLHQSTGLNVRCSDKYFYPDIQYTYSSRFCVSRLVVHSCSAVHSKPGTVLQMSNVWARTNAWG